MNISSKTGQIVRIGVLTAVLILLEITNLGFIKTPTGLELTIMQIPVLVGAIVMGPVPGAFLGGVFGLTSFFECFGKSFFGAALLSINPIYTFILCFVPRVLMGWCCGLIFRFLEKHVKNKMLPYAAASLAGALLNTVFFMSALILLFGRTEYIMGFRGDMPVIPFILAFVGVQGLIEAIICFLCGSAISYGVMRFVSTKAD